MCGYAGAVGGALLLTALWYASLPPAVLQQSGGMVAGGQLMWFLGFTGLFGLAPTYFLLKELAGARWLWNLLAAGGAATGLSALAAEAAVAAAYLGGGYKYGYPDPAFFNLSCLAWLHYKAPFIWRFLLSPAALAGLLCVYLAAPRSGARRLLGWAALAEFSATLAGVCIAFLFMRNHIFHP